MPSVLGPLWDIWWKVHSHTQLNTGDPSDDVSDWYGPFFQKEHYISKAAGLLPLELHLISTNESLNIFLSIFSGMGRSPSPM